MIVPGIRIIGLLGVNRQQMPAGSTILIMPTELVRSETSKAVSAEPDSPAPDTKRRWWQRPPPEERRENRARMLEEGTDAAMLGGSIAWMLLYPNKFTIAAKILLMFGVGTANNASTQVTGKDYTDYDPQGA